MQTKLFSVGLALALGAAHAAPAFAQAKPETLVKQRQAAMTLVGKYWGPLGGMAQGKVPYNAGTVARNAAFLEALSKMPWDGFAASTKDVESRALPAVFSQPDKFKAAAESMESEIAKLVTTVKGGDEAAIKGQLKAVGKTCGGCHNDFREKR